jgi:Arc/MetJ-type ribon-helix-helix transcriptional regulator
MRVDVVRWELRLPRDLANELDGMIKAFGFRSRAFFLRHALRRAAVVVPRGEWYQIARATGGRPVPTRGERNRIRNPRRSAAGRANALKRWTRFREAQERTQMAQAQEMPPPDPRPPQDPDQPLTGGARQR